MSNAPILIVGIIIIIGLIVLGFVLFYSHRNQSGPLAPYIQPPLKNGFQPRGSKMVNLTLAQINARRAAFGYPPLTKMPTQPWS